MSNNVNAIPLKAVAPAVPVRKTEDVYNAKTRFYIRELDMFLSQRYDRNIWRVTCVDDDGQPFLMMLGDNGYRSAQFAQIRDAVRDGQVVGPCMLSRVSIAGQRHPAWHIEDAS